MIAVRVRVDDADHRLRAEFLDLVENRLAPSRVLRVDDGDAVGHDEHRGVAAAALSAQNEQVVLQLSDFHDPGRLLTGCGRRLLIRRDRVRQPSERQKHAEEDDPSHAMPPGKNTR